MIATKNRRGPAPDYKELCGTGKKLAESIGEMSQAQAARELEITAAFLNHLIRGRKRPGRELAVRIQEEFGIRVEEW